MNVFQITIADNKRNKQKKFFRFAVADNKRNNQTKFFRIAIADDKRKRTEEVTENSPRWARPSEPGQRLDRRQVRLVEGQQLQAIVEKEQIEGRDSKIK